MKAFIRPLCLSASVMFAAASALALNSPAQTVTATAANAPAYNQKNACAAALVDIDKMLDAKVDDAVIVAYIHNCHVDFQLSASDIIALKDRGASPEVLKAMVEYQPAAGAAVGPQTAPMVQPPMTQTPDYYSQTPAYSYPAYGYDYGYPYDYPYYSSYYPYYNYYPYYYADYGWPYFYFSPFFLGSFNHFHHFPFGFHDHFAGRFDHRFGGGFDHRFGSRFGSGLVTSRVGTGFGSFRGPATFHSFNGGGFHSFAGGGFRGPTSFHSFSGGSGFHSFSGGGGFHGGGGGFHGGGGGHR